MFMARIRQKPPLGRQVLLVLAAILGILCLLVLALVLAEPPDVFKNNLLLHMIRQKHEVVRWFSK
jgi:hypothetical protein